MRVTTAFNRLLRLPGASVTDVEFSPMGVIVSVRLKRRRRVCGRCGQLAGHVTRMVGNHVADIVNRYGGDSAAVPQSLTD